MSDAEEDNHKEIVLFVSTLIYWKVFLCECYEAAIFQII